MQELHSHLERLRQENADLEEKVVAMSVYQKEVQALRDEIVKLQVIVKFQETPTKVLIIIFSTPLSRHRKK